MTACNPLPFRRVTAAQDKDAAVAALAISDDVIGMSPPHPPKR
jgi:hypothetical protein